MKWIDYKNVKLFKSIQELQIIEMFRNLNLPIVVNENTKLWINLRNNYEKYS